jgi:hypothetical protein
LEDEDEVGVAVDEVVEVDLLVAAELVEKLGLLDLPHHEALDGVHQVLLLALPPLQYVPDEERPVLHETGSSHSPVGGLALAVDPRRHLLQ